MFLYRDTDLPESLIKTYEVGRLYQERAFVDTSRFRSSPTGNTRYLIAPSESLKGIDYRKLEIDPADEVMVRARDEWGMVIVQRDFLFCVIDIYRREATTQILIVAQDAATSRERKRLVADARRDLDDLANSPPIVALTSAEWKQRVTFPLGLDDTGKAYPI